ncbi:hypothetical protein Q5752_002039 [Cryptotrichosporon argae]
MRPTSTLSRIRAHTLLSPTPASLAAYLAQHPPSGSSATLYSLSLSHADPALLAPLRGRPNSIGSFHVAPAPVAEPALAIAHVEDATVFRSELSGRGHAEVGRWQRPGNAWPEDARGRGEGEMERVRREEGWAGMWRAVDGGNVPDLEGVSAAAFVLLTDATPRPLLSALDRLYPAAAKVGLVTAPTPFITGRPHTLLHGERVYEAGALGLALRTPLDVAVDYGVEPLSEPFTIAAAQGNMLLRLAGDSPNPAQTLIASIQRRDRTRATQLVKDEEFYLRLERAGGAGEGVVKILSGDPGRGAISLETEDSLVPGQVVQFMQRKKRHTPHPLAHELALTVVPRTDSVENGRPGEPHTVDGFRVGSEGGIIADGVCTVTGAVARAASSARV